MNGEIKKIETSHRLFAIFLVLILGILGYFIGNLVYKFKSLSYPREITVSSEGRAFAKPDVAIVKLGVTTEGWEIKKIVKENTEKMNEILKEIKNLQIQEKDIQTTKYNLYPRYEWKEGERIFKGYSLEQEVMVKIRNFEKIGEVIEKSTEKGANLIGDLSFTIDDLEPIYQKTREEAIEKAKKIAERISALTGIKLKKIVNVYEEPYSLIDLSARGGGGEKLAVPLAPEIQPGEKEVKVKINLVYQIE